MWGSTEVPINKGDNLYSLTTTLDFQIKEILSLHYLVESEIKIWTKSLGKILKFLFFKQGLSEKMVSFLLKEKKS